MDAIKKLRECLSDQGTFNAKQVHQLMVWFHASYDVHNQEELTLCDDVINYFSKKHRKRNMIECSYVSDTIERAFIIMVAGAYSTSREYYDEKFTRWILMRYARMKKNEDLCSMAINSNVALKELEDMLTKLATQDVGVFALYMIRDTYILPCSRSAEEEAESHQRSLTAFKWLNENSALWKKHAIFPSIGKFPAFTQIPLFYLTYHDANVCNLMAHQGKLYNVLLDSWYSKTSMSSATFKKLRTTRRRIGFLSRSLGSHSVGRISYGLLEKLASCGMFDIYVYTDNILDTLIGRRLNSVVKKVKTLDNQLSVNIRMLREENLDVLVLLDPLQDTLTYIISSYRCAPVQVSTWGHPGTTGLETIDHYVTSKLFMEKQDFFTEKLVLFESLSIYYRHINELVRPCVTEPFDIIPYMESKGVAPIRFRLSIPLNARVYGIVGPVFKISAMFDDVMVGILRNDPQAMLVMVRGDNDHLLMMTVKRLEDKITAKEMDRVCIIPNRLELLEFSSYIYACDVVIDTFPFGGLISLYDTLSVGRCMVSMPCQRLGKFTQGLYKRMGSPELLEHLIATDVDDYVKKAVKVANDRPHRKMLEGHIRENLYKVHEDSASFEDWANFLSNVQVKSI